MRINVAVLVTSLLSFCLCSELFEPKSGIHELSARTFKNEVLYNGNVTAVLFYAPWCGYCQGLAPEWKQAAKSLRGIARVAAVDCNEDKNKQLCAKYEIQGFPTIKVFQPAKLTDVDFKDAAEDKPLKRRRPTMYNYNGARDAKSITSFVVDKLRNYAATLDSDKALLWLAPNKVPRVVMLPGKKYKSKSISPLFKVLSREYFGKIRFGYVPRRVDGAWNLLGIPAPDESQLVYLSDDRKPLVYKGSMKKRDLKQFIDEQYMLEMDRRLHKGQPQTPDRDFAAMGLEYVTEDPQDSEMEHVRAQREKDDEMRRIAESAHKEAFERHGKQFPGEKPQTKAQSSSTTTTAGEAATATDGERGVEAEDFEYTGSEGDTEPESEDAEFEDSNDDAILDEAVIELTADQIVQEGPEAIASFMAAQAPSKTKSDGKAATTTAANPRPTKRKQAGMHSYDDFVARCLRTGFNCAIVVTTEDQLQSDIVVIMRSMERLSSKLKAFTLFDYILAGKNPELDEFLSEINLNSRPGMLFWDARRQRFTQHREGWSQRELTKFLNDGYSRKLELDGQLSPKYLYWLTAEEVEKKAAEAASKDVKDEL